MRRERSEMAKQAQRVQVSSCQELSIIILLGLLVLFTKVIDTSLVDFLFFLTLLKLENLWFFVFFLASLRNRNKCAGRGAHRSAAGRQRV